MLHAIYTRVSATMPEACTEIENVVHFHCTPTIIVAEPSSQEWKFNKISH